MEPRTPELFREKKRIFAMNTQRSRDLPPDEHRAKVMRDTVGVIALWEDETVTVTFDPIPPLPWPRTKEGQEAHDAAFYAASWHYSRTFKSQAGATRSYNTLHQGYWYESREDFHDHIAKWSGGKRVRVKQAPAHHITIEVGGQQSQGPKASDERNHEADDDGYSPIPRKRNGSGDFIARIVVVGIAILLAISLYSVLT